MTETTKNEPLSFDTRRERGDEGAPSKPVSLVKVTAIFASGNLLSTVLRLLGGILTSRAVEPAVLGLFNGIGLVMGYIPFLQAGVLNGLNRDLPYFTGRGDRERTRELAAAAEAWVLVVCGLAIVGLLTVASWHGLHGRWQLALGWSAYVIPVVGSMYGQRYLGVLYRAFGRFPRLSYIGILAAAAGVVLVSVVWAWGFIGLCLRVMGIWGLTLALFWKWRPLHVRPRWSFGNLKVLAVTGMPIFAVGQLFAWWPVLNSTLVLRYAGTEGLGLYAIANLAGPTVAMFPKALGQVVYPRMAEEYGRGAPLTALVRLVVRPTILTFILTAGIVGLAWLLIPPVIRLVLPKYIEGTVAAQWSVVGALVLALTPVNNVFNVVRRQDLYGLAMVIGMMAYLACLWLLLQNGIDLSAFPKAMIAGQAVFVVTCFGLIWHLSRRPDNMAHGDGLEC